MATSNQHHYYEKKLEELIKIMPDYIVEYFDAKWDYRSFLTLYHYARDFQVFLEWLIAEHITDAKEIKDIPTDVLATLSRTQADAFFKMISRKKYKVAPTRSNEEKQVSKKTVNRMQSSLRSLFKYLSNEAETTNAEPYFHRNVMAKIEVNKVKETLNERAKLIQNKIYTNNKDSAFLEYVREKHELSLTDGQRKYFKRDNERDYAILSLFLGSGVRLNELANLKLEDIDFLNNEVRVLRKGDKMDTVAVVPEAMTSLKEYIEIRSSRYAADDDPNAYVFISKGSNGYSPLSNRAIQKVVEKYTKAFDQRLSAHKLRHTYATNLAEETGDLSLVMSQLGHTSPETSLLYINSSREKAQKAAKALGQRWNKKNKME